MTAAALNRRCLRNNRLSLDIPVEACEALLRPGHARAQPMPAIRRFGLRLLSFFRPGAAEAELSREIHSHLQLLEDEFVSKGMPRGEARLAARRPLGGGGPAQGPQPP